MSSNTGRTVRVRGLIALLFCVSILPLARAQDAAHQEKGIVPIPEYTGDLFSRSHLAGDLGGTRTDLAKKGIQLNVDWVQTMQSVVTGGRDTGTKYGGSLDYVLTLDLYRMGLIPGAMIKIRGESRYGESVPEV